MITLKSLGVVFPAACGVVVYYTVIMKKIFIVFGTRPEAIKMASLIKAFFEAEKGNAEVRVCDSAAP